MAITMKDVADRAGVSTATVSRVINDRPTHPDLRKRVKTAIAELGYRPNGVARSLRVMGTRTLGIVISDLTNPFFTELARAVEAEARRHGLSLIVGNANEQPDQLDHYVGALLERQVDGLLAVPTAERSELLLEAVDRDHPVILLDRDLPGSGVPVVRSDSVAAVHALVDHLVSLGHRRLAIISGPLQLVTGRERLAAFRAALARHGLELPEDYLRVGDFQLDSGVQATAELLALPRPPQAVFAADNLMGLGAMQEIAAQGARIPEDIALAVFDDLPWFPLARPPITAIAQDTERLGRIAVETLLTKMAGGSPSSTLLPCRLVPRCSCGEPCPPPSARTLADRRGPAWDAR